MRRTCVHDLLLAVACLVGMASAAAADELPRDPYLRCLLKACEAAPETIEPDTTVERTERDGPFRVELVQMPAQPPLSPAPLVDQVVAVINQQLEHAQPPLSRPRKQRGFEPEPPKDAQPARESLRR